MIYGWQGIYYLKYKKYLIWLLEKNILFDCWKKIKQASSGDMLEKNKIY